MKRTLVAVSALLAVSALAVLPPGRAPLPNLDRRASRAANLPNEVAPEQAVAVSALRSRVPGLKVTRSVVLGSPVFFSSTDALLTGPDAQGLGVLPATAQGIPSNDPHRAVKAFLNEHAGLIGYNASALTGARVSRDYVATHNGMRTVVWQQELNGLPVFEAITMGHITSQGELVNLYSHFLPDASTAAARGLKGRATVAAAAGAVQISVLTAMSVAAGNLGDVVAPGSLTSLGAAQGPALKQTFRGSGALNGDQYGELVWLPMNSGLARLCWQVIITSKARGEMFLLLVDAETGEVLLRRNLTSYITNSTYNVWTSDSPSPFSPGYPTPGNPAQPAVIARTLVTIPALNTNASPLGWIAETVNETLGNNVDAHTDHNDNNQADLPRPTGNPFHVFDFPIDLAKSPTNYSTGAVVQLFYWNNFVHDKLWEMGFTEAAGNFQTTNFGRGGLGNDAVQADAQDGGTLNDGFHVNNANMFTPPDGFPARMQMYLFDGTDPDRDGDFDAEIIIHEYMHGLSNRRVGGGIGISTLQAAGMGEGWGDFYGLSMLSESNDPINGEWAMGGYATLNFAGLNLTDNYYFGIRHFPYSTNLLKNPFTFKDIDPTQISPHAGIPRSPLYLPYTPFEADEVHHQGEVWCVTLFEMRANLIAKYGFAGNRVALQLVTDAMALCPPNPNFLQSRDAILQADVVNNTNANYAEIWKAFAKRGMGSSATSPNSTTTVGVHESFDFPGLAVTTVAVNDVFSGNGNGAIDFNECVEISVGLRNNSVTTARSVSGTLRTTTPGVTIAQSNAVYADLAPGASGLNLTPYRVYTDPTFVCGTPIQFALVASAITTTQSVTTNLFQLRSGFVSLNPTLINNSTPASIPDGSTNGVESLINVSGLAAAVGKITVSLHLTHTYASDLLLQLIGPDGTTVDLSQNQGGAGQNFGASCSPTTLRTTFDDNAPQALSSAVAPFIGTFRPDETLTAFAGKSGAALNGTWRLRIVDGFPQDAGTLQCWTLALYPTLCTNGGGTCVSDVALNATAAPDPAVAGFDLTYQLAVTNSRPIPASAVVLTHVLSSNATFVSALSSQAACAFNNGTVTCVFGTLPVGANASATIVIRPLAVGLISSVFSAGSSTPDSNLSNNVVTLNSVVIGPAPAFAAAGAQVVAESIAPPTGGIEAGETVSVNLGLRNVGPIASGNLVATLIEGNGVIAPGAAQSYGAIASGGVGTQLFSFSAPGAPGTSIDAVLQLQDGVQNLGVVTFHFTVGGEVTFENNAPIVINQFGASTPYPSVINAGGVVGSLAGVRATFTKLTHSFPDDIDALLVSPQGQRLLLMSDAGGNVAITNRTLTFDDAAAGPLPNETGLVAGSFRPSNFDSGTEPGGDIFPAPAPVGSLITSLAGFAGSDPNGPWSLFIHDDGGGDAGSVSGGWSLTLNTVYPVNPLADLAVTAVAVPAAPILDEPLTLILTVTNLGPSNAPSVVLTDVLPAGSSFVNGSASQGGGVSFAAGVVTANLGSMNVGSSATVTIQLTPTALGLAVNSATVSGALTDLVPVNNTAITALTVGSPVGDVSLSVVASAQPVFLSSNVVFTVLITNRGPNHAAHVQAGTFMASVLSVVSAVTTQGGCVFASGQALCDLGDLPANGSAVVTITAVASSIGSAPANFAVSSDPTDPVPANNSTNLLCTVIPTSPVIVPAGSALLNEALPANGSIESGETVTLSFGLRNVGNADAADLIATLLPTGGVTGPGGPFHFGALLANGPTVSKPYSFTAGGAPGSALTATFQLSDNGQSLGTAVFAFTLSASRSFTNSNLIIIPNQGQATNYPSTLNVSGIAGAASRVTVNIKQLTHTFPEDIDLLLVGPAGQKVLLMSDAGAGNAVSGVNLTFDDAATALPFSSIISSGTYHGTDYPPGDTFPAPAPAGPYGTNLAVFNGINPNGTWSLYIFDDAVGDAGRVDGGWTLNIQTAAPIVSAADVAVTAIAPTVVESGTPFSYVLTVANFGPAPATGVTLSDSLPAGFILSGVTVSQGSYSTGPGTITANLGALALGATATVTVNGAAVGPITLVNLVSVSAVQADPNPANNLLAPATTVNALALTIQRSDGNVIITWPFPAPGYVLQSAATIEGPFTNSGLSVTTVNGRNQVVAPATGSTYYRLQKP